MPTTDEIRRHWDAQASKGQTAGTQDLILKELEQRAILGEIDASYNRFNRYSVLEVGCGLGETAGYVGDLLHTSHVLAIDSSEAMIAACVPHKRVRYQAGSVAELPSGLFDLVYTQRCLINLPSWQEQKQAIDAIADRLVAGGRFITCEHSQDGLDAINQERERLELPCIDRPWHNLYFRQAQLNTITSLRLAKHVPFSATYYFLSRIVNAKLAAQSGQEPAYDAPVNRLALELPYTAVDPRFAQGQLWVWEKA